MTGPARFLTAAVTAILPLVVLLHAGGVRAQEGTAAEAAQPLQLAQGATVGSEVCLECHNNAPVNLILHRPHAQMADSRTPFAKGGCETCHGPGGDHAANPSLPIGINFGPKSATPAAKQNEICLTCHQGGERINWQASQHASADRTCASCHDVHSTKDRVLAKASQPDVCFTCHKEQRAQSMKRSHHPIREGKVVCSDCHNPHGSFGPSQLTKNTVNETCYQCHAEKRGPFLWEHAPVVDNCSNCHTPHGSSQPRMLTVRTPMLCQQCHAEGFHPSDPYGGQNLPGTGSITNRSARLFAKGCLNCHPMIHGTNHPSGPRLTR